MEIIDDNNGSGMKLVRDNVGEIVITMTIRTDGNSVLSIKDFSMYKRIMDNEKRDIINRLNGRY